MRLLVSDEIAKGLSTVEKLVAEKSELSDSLRDCREAYDTACQERNDLSAALDAVRLEHATTTSQLDVCRFRFLFMTFTQKKSRIT